MKIGYPCINRTIGCKGDRTFRLKSYSEQRLMETVENNLDCLLQMLRYNVEHNLLFFRITSDLVPFASHPVCRFDWRGYFRDTFVEIGEFIKAHDVRISMHPDQFTLINSLDTGVLERSVAELLYHAEVLDALGLDGSAKIQIHVGGVYGDKGHSMSRFVERFRQLPGAVAGRLVIENDDRLFTLADCLQVSSDAGIPVLFDVFHHGLNSSGETVKEAVEKVSRTWRSGDGVPMVDYSSQRAGGRRARHAESIDLGHFRSFLAESRPHDIDIMLEIKDKEASALKAVEVARGDGRFRVP